MNLPSFRTYGSYASDNYGAHALVFSQGGEQFWFSYQTLVAFTHGGRRYVRVNDWGTTTGKHLNAIDNGNRPARLSAEAFELAYQEAFGQ